MEVTAKPQKDSPRIGTYLDILKQDKTLFEITQNCLDQLDDPADRMYAVCWAPALVKYVMWVLTEALHDGQERLYFLARDAYPMYYVAKQLVRMLKIKIEIRYLRVSRYSLRIPEYHLIGEQCLDRIFLSGIDVSLYQILNRAGLDEEEMLCVSKQIHYEKSLKKNLNPREIRKLKDDVLRCCREHKTDLLDKINKRSRSAYAATIGYLKQEGLLDPVRYAVVDSGWVGTIQQSLRTLLAQENPEIQIAGYYFGLYAIPEKSVGCHYKAYYFEPKGTIRRKAMFSNCLYEVMYSEPCAMVKGYVCNDGKYAPVLSDMDNPNKEYLHRNEKILKLYMSSGLFAWMQQRDDDLVEQLYRTVMATPNVWEAHWYGKQLFSDDLADDHLREIANKLNQKEISNLRIGRKSMIMMGILHQELHESGWIEGTIVNAGKHVAANLRAARRAKYLTYIRQSVKARKLKDEIDV